MKVVHRIDGRTALASEALTSQSQFNYTLPEARRDNRTSRQLKLCLVQVKLQSEEHEQDCKNEYRRKTGFLDQVEYILESAVRHGLHSVFPGNAKAKVSTNLLSEQAPLRHASKSLVKKGNTH